MQANLKTEVDTLNNSMKSIADLNRRIQSLMNIGCSTATLEDQRDIAVKAVAKQMDISYFTDGEGAVVVQTKQGQVLVDTEARTIETDQSTLTNSMVYPGGITGLVIKGTNTQGDIDLTQAHPGGTIGALLDLRDVELPSYSAQADELAYKMMVRFNDQGVRLFTTCPGSCRSTTLRLMSVSPPISKSMTLSSTTRLCYNAVRRGHPSMPATTPSS